MKNLLIVLLIILPMATSYGKGGSSRKDLSSCVQGLISYEKGGSLYSVRRWPERLHQPECQNNWHSTWRVTGKFQATRYVWKIFSVDLLENKGFDPAVIGAGNFSGGIFKIDSVNPL